MLDHILKAVLGSIGEGVVVADREGRFLYFNPLAERVLGLSATHTFAAEWAERCGAFQPDQTTPFPVDDQPLLRAVRGEHTGDTTMFVQSHGAPGGHWISILGRPVQDARGTLHGGLVVFRDVTEQRRTLDAVEAQLRQVQKMEAIGRLAGGIAHDFNNVLSVILSHAALLLEDLPAGSESLTDALQVQAAAERGRKLTGQLLSFSQRHVMKPSAIDLNVIVRDMESLITRLMGEDVTVTLRTAQGLGNVFVDRSQVEQVLMNLVINARDAMPEGGRLAIETANVELDERYSESHIHVSPGEYVMLSVTDTGLGIDPVTRERIFEPFFTTKERGTGLGLATVYGIVKQSGGHVWVYSEVEHGTTFKLYFPRYGSAQRDRGDSLGPAPRGQGETVLLVEDEPLVRRATSAILRRAGYDVLEASDGAEALKLALQSAARVQVMVVDVILADETGPQLAKKLLKLCPDARVLFTSGYNEEHLIGQVALERGAAFLQKPVTPDALLVELRRLVTAR